MVTYQAAIDAKYYYFTKFGCNGTWKTWDEASRYSHLIRLENSHMIEIWWQMIFQHLPPPLEHLFAITTVTSYIMLKEKSVIMKCYKSIFNKKAVFITKCHEMNFLQSVSKIYYKVRQKVITKWVTYYKVRPKFITKCLRYYKEW